MGFRGRRLPPAAWRSPPTYELLNDAAELASHDPVAAAKMAEYAGYPSLAGDCWLLAGDVLGALAVRPTAAPGSKAGLQSQARIVLTLVLNRPLTAADVLAVVQPKITELARMHPDALLEAIQVALEGERSYGRDLGVELLSLPDLHWSGWLMFNGTMRATYVEGLPMPFFNSSRAAADLLRPLHRQAENALREDLGYAHVGQGWVAETELFLLIRDTVGGQTGVEQHGVPQGFGRQHLDVWLPDWRIGVEYQGEQHDRPVDFFGGEDAWKLTVARDRAKRAKCKRLGIALIEVRPGYVPDEVLARLYAARRDTFPQS
jgi:hypothetical protein